MKICVTARGNDLNAEVDPRFGRCTYFIIVDTETNEWSAVKNESAFASGGAGIQAAQTVARMGVDVVLTGNVGPNAYSTLSASGIDIYTGASGTVEEVIERFRKGEFDTASGPTSPPHAGMGSGRRRGF